MRGSRNFLPEWVQLWRFIFSFFSDNEAGRIYIPLKVGHHRLASETPSKWRFAGGPIMAQHWMLAWFFRGSGPLLLRNPIFLWFLWGGGGPLDPPMKRYLPVTVPPLRIATILTMFDRKFSLDMEIAQTLRQRDVNSLIEKTHDPHKNICAFTPPPPTLLPFTPYHASWTGSFKIHTPDKKSRIDFGLLVIGHSESQSGFSFI